MALWGNVSSVDDVWSAYHNFLELGGKSFAAMHSPWPIYACLPTWDPTFIQGAVWGPLKWANTTEQTLPIH